MTRSCSTSIEKVFADTKGVIRICNSKKNRQHSGQKNWCLLF